MNIHRNIKIYRQKGFALVEVLVSIFIMAIGMMALLGAQLRSVTSVRDSETQTIVAQAAQNLIEGMIANPTLTADGAWTKKSYDDYLNKTDTNVTSCNNIYQTGTTYDKAALAERQLCSFKYELTQKLKDKGVKFQICQDNDFSDTPTIGSGGNIDGKCSNSGDTAIKVVWQVQPKDESTDDVQIMSFQTYVRDN
ncbi:MAG: type IV pilus modification protein PilV [Neisseria sp.]|nr:type IV pilus modification protein PilV [Neisseria sp.]